MNYIHTNNPKHEIVDLDRLKSVKYDSSYYDLTFYLTDSESICWGFEDEKKCLDMRDRFLNHIKSCNLSDQITILE